MAERNFSAQLAGKFVDDDDLIRTGRAWVEIDGSGFLHIPVPKETGEVVEAIEAQSEKVAKDAETSGKYASAAKSSASAAATSASKAAGSESTVARDAAAAKDSANRSETAAGNAANRVGEIKAFATAADASASKALASERNASTSATQAADSASAAASDANRAEQASKETIAQVQGDYATRPYVDAQVWDRGMLSSPVDILSLKPGRYGIFSSSVYKGMNLPGNSAGLLIVDYLDGPNGRIYGRFWWEYQDSTYGRICYSASSYNGNFRGWQPDNTWHKMPLTKADKIVDLPPGRYPVTSESVATSLGLPWSGMGYLEMEWLGSSLYQRVDWWTGVSPTHHWRISIYNKGWEKAVWEHLHGGEMGADGFDYQKAGADAVVASIMATNDPTTSYESDHAALVGDLKRRVGPVNVGDAGALALVFDHGTTAFREWIWPELKKRKLVGTMALCPEVHLDDKGDSRHRVTNDEIKAWVKDGLVIASHSGDHEGAKTTTDIYRQVVVSKQVLESKLDTKVDCWVQPGYALSGGDYKGFGTGQNATDYTNTMAGRLLQQTYPVITGYVGDDYLYPMQDLPVGVQRSLMERKESVAEVRNYVKQASERGLKHISFIHPYALPDSSDTYATKQDYIDFLDLVVQLRDAGKLKVLTLPQLEIAEK
ncbi:polysaccharide deacetylase family protein [Corynebacterium marquesiae]|uniref:polysaccharide deacetylase family protein n=1 Tax=Corynebacterium marquesiae TaxID=2913503 RepID=UPI0038D05BB8